MRSGRTGAPSGTVVTGGIVVAGAGAGVAGTVVAGTVVGGGSAPTSVGPVTTRVRAPRPATTSTVSGCADLRAAARRVTAGHGSDRLPVLTGSDEPYDRGVQFPERRMRRLRRTPALRRLVAETRLSVDDLIAPLFVREGIDGPQPIRSLPGVAQHTRDSLRKEVAELVDLGVPAVVLFGIPEHKDGEGSEAWNPDGIVQVALKDLRDDVGDGLVLIPDLCLDEYTDHGHCGVLTTDGRVDNDATVERYGLAAVAQAEAGADIVAPSGMMDGQVRGIRAALDGAGFVDVAILAYAAKYASALYGPFREAVDVEIADGGDRKGYQQDPRNGREALEEIRLDVEEGADVVMVKPALAYLDVIAHARAEVDVPLAAYHVSGEYAMVKAAAEKGWIDGDAVLAEHLTAIRRAGADMILTYAAREIAPRL